jgi:alpha-glucosidase
MYYDYPTKEEAYQFKYQYLFGEDMIVAPVSDSVSATNMLANQQVWLPEGKWYEWHSGSLLTGGKTINRKFALDEIPLYAKAGSIIPMYPKVSNLQQPVNDWVLSIVPGGNGSVSVYEDDDTTNDYSKGKFAVTKINTEINGSNTSITISPRRGEYNGMSNARTYELRLLRTFPAKSINVNGVDYPFSEEKKPGTWRYDGLTLTNIISIPPTAAASALNIEMKYDEKYIGKEDLLNQKIMLFRRLSSITGKMKLEVARKSWWSMMPDEVLAAEQTPVKIQYNPAVILDVLKEFNTNYSKTRELLLQHPDARPEVAKKYVQYLEYE